jgi:hypothetical protein
MDGWKDEQTGRQINRETGTEILKQLSWKNKVKFESSLLCTT